MKKMLKAISALAVISCLLSSISIFAATPTPNFGFHEITGIYSYDRDSPSSMMVPFSYTEVTSDANIAAAMENAVKNSNSPLTDRLIAIFKIQVEDPSVTAMDVALRSTTMLTSTLNHDLYCVVQMVDGEIIPYGWHFVSGKAYIDYLYNDLISEFDPWDTLFYSNFTATNSNAVLHTSNNNAAYYGIYTFRSRPSITNLDAGQFANYEGFDFYSDGAGSITCTESATGTPVINDFKCDGIYTYYFQADGTAMKNRLTYHPNGENVIYFDQNGHEVFDNFAYVEQSISGEPVDDMCYFNTFGYMYTDVLTYDFAGEHQYYANPYGVIERSGWFRFPDGGLGYSDPFGKLLTNTFCQDPWNRTVYLQGNGRAAGGLITDGLNFYEMDVNDGHLLGMFPA